MSTERVFKLLYFTRKMYGKIENFENELKRQRLSDKVSDQSLHFSILYELVSKLFKPI